MEPPPGTRVLGDAEELAQEAARWLCETAALATAGRRASVCLAGGTTPRRLYELLASPAWSGRFPWGRVHWFWGDERFVPHDDPRSDFLMAQDAMLSRAPVPPTNIHPIRTAAAATPHEAAAAYACELAAFQGAAVFDPARPLFDVVLLGLGEDGHIASLFPGTPALEERRAWATAVLGAKPEARITLTYPALESARHTAFLVSGAGKRAALGLAWQGGGDIPAARLRPVGKLHWFVDRAAVPSADDGCERPASSPKEENAP